MGDLGSNEEIEIVIQSMYSYSIMKGGKGGGVFLHSTIMVVNEIMKMRITIIMLLNKVFIFKVIYKARLRDTVHTPTSFPYLAPPIQSPEMFIQSILNSPYQENHPPSYHGDR